VGLSFVMLEAGNVQRAASIGDCAHHAGPVPVAVSVSKYPHIWRHIKDAQAGRNTLSDGRTVVNNGLRWPSVLVKNNHDEDSRRKAAFAASHVPAKRGFNRDEYPPAMGRSSQLADIRYVPVHENKSQGSVMGHKMADYCNGQEFKFRRAP
jgi:hypothetical protein